MSEYNKLAKALKRLEEKNRLYKSENMENPHKYTESVKESLIKRFEYCFDCLWKALKFHLKEKIKNLDIPNSPRPLFEIALQHKILTPSKDKWFAYCDVRNASAHDYNERKAQNTIDIVDDFIGDTISAYQSMTGEEWK